ncbi:SDR family NAD(P)-dependent oxidoreductase [Dyadobacter subterraneus]|uniref:SDR family NAD(P)-dependent oxidoreductase n=1 Tax=Dyadobacter subterraneus TaxID=2773304 RepID=A0ABR9W7G7_9BACT|nr:SDR family NAD(P)-dependent oxidoreductase [Dyadobacter subterraneus]MBE9461413.1 SDR family NAD(P)-dependent oxidoreductase [Dyadobacter subterraneus]
MNKSIMITGANSGVGKETARQLGMLDGTEKIYLACRNKDKALEAKTDLEKQTGKQIFEIIIMDISNLTSVRQTVNSLKNPIDALIMNAGGGGTDPMALTKDGVTEIFAANVLGHALLLEELIKSNKLVKTALYVGSEASRGIPKMKMKLPPLKSSSVEEFETIINGTFFNDKKVDGMIVYGQVKYVGEMWLAAMARKHSGIKMLSISPGSTQGTRTADAFSPVFRFFYNNLLMPFIFPMMGLSHKLETGARRLVDGITNPSYKNGAFYGSKENVLVGPVIDQSTIFPDLKNEVYQDNAYEAVRRYIG